MSHLRAFQVEETPRKSRDPLAGPAWWAVGSQRGESGGSEVRNEESRREAVGDGTGTGAVQGLGQMVRPRLTTAPTPV